MKQGYCYLPPPLCQQKLFSKTVRMPLWKSLLGIKCLPSLRISSRWEVLLHVQIQPYAKQNTGSFDKYLLSLCSALGAILGTEGTEMKKNRERGSWVA